ncbi:SRPBCC family protein [Adhaeribacter sp. BT258]|uniref:SRPBCC family protein n=1 Tax=Adhaeribacter terrigena TaxID=2793070 RepID=A0ABS1C0V5_9BACT|nr:SRPBCC family protein [Adhaeribacter terrigena]MBK0403036.1 SRPBCC family protein [Adhaeribacter terrigena]
MKLLKKLGLGFLGLIALLIAVSFLLPGKVHVERSLVMKAKAETTFNQVNNLKNWEKWSPWHQMDPNIQLTYEGPEAGVGAKYSWTSNEVGNGALTIAESQANQTIKTAMDFGNMGTSYAMYKFEPVEDGTKVTWSMDSDCADMPWTWYVPSKYMGLFMDDMLGKDFEKGLNNLKIVVENMPAASAAAFTVEEKTIPAQQVLSMKAVCIQEQLSEKLGELYGKMAAEMKKSKLEFAGHPSAVYHKYDPKAIEFEAIIPVNKAGKTNGDIIAKEIKGGPVAITTHFGPHEGTYSAHMAMDKWLTDNKKALKGSPWEVYVTDPGKEKDPAKWLTEIYYPL